MRWTNNDPYAERLFCPECGASMDDSIECSYGDEDDVTDGYECLLCGSYFEEGMTARELRREARRF